MKSTSRTLCLVICGAGPAPQVHILADMAMEAGWSVRLVATPAAMALIDADALRQRTGSSVRHDYQAPGQTGRRASAADALIVAPATYNTVNKLAAGINDTYALNVIAEAVGRRTPVVILPFVNAALAARAPFEASVAALRTEGVQILYGPGEWMPHPPGTGDEHLAGYPWHLALAAAERATADA